MLKYLVKFEHTVNGKEGAFLLPPDTPTMDAKEMCFQFLKMIDEIETNAKAQMPVSELPQDQSTKELKDEEAVAEIPA
jgi:hypothetical protein